MSSHSPQNRTDTRLTLRARILIAIAGILVVAMFAAMAIISYSLERSFPSPPKPLRENSSEVRELKNRLANEPTAAEVQKRMQEVADELFATLVRHFGPPMLHGMKSPLRPRVALTSCGQRYNNISSLQSASQSPVGFEFNRTWHDDETMAVTRDTRTILERHGYYNIQHGFYKDTDYIIFGEAPSKIVAEITINRQYSNTTEIVLRGDSFCNIASR